MSQPDGRSEAFARERREMPGYARLRDLCLALPGTQERVSHGEPSWFVGKQFVTFAGRHHDDRVAFWGAAPPGDQQHWVGHAPARFFVPPYVGHRGWIGVYLDVEQDWHEVAEIVDAAWRCVAPKRLLAQRDAAAGGLAAGGSASGGSAAAGPAAAGPGVGGPAATPAPPRPPSMRAAAD